MTILYHKQKFIHSELDWNVRLEIIRFLKEDVSSKLLDFTLSIFFFLDLTQWQKNKKHINKWDYIKINSFCLVKGSQQQNEFFLSRISQICKISKLLDGHLRHVRQVSVLSNFVLFYIIKYAPVTNGNNYYFVSKVYSCLLCYLYLT